MTVSLSHFFFNISFFFRSDGLEVSFDGYPHGYVIFFLVVEILVFMPAFPSGLLGCS